MPMPMANPDDLPTTFALHDARNQAGPAQQRRQRQRHRPAKPVAVETTDSRDQHFKFTGSGERDQDAGWLAASAAASAARSASCATRPAARQLSKGSGAGAPANSSV